MKKMLTLCTVCFALAGGLFAADTKIATVDLDMILLCHPKMDNINQQLKNLHEMYSGQVDDKANKVERLRDTLRTVLDKINDPAANDKVKETNRATAREIDADIVKLTNEFLELRDRLNRQFSETKADLLDAVLDDINEKLSKYAKDIKYDLVLNKSINIPTVLYATSSIDITEAVVKATGGDVKKAQEKVKELERSKK